MNPTVPFPHKGEGALRDKTLDSWKEIARFLNRDVRTVMRWEKSRALPVRRMPGGKKPGVYAMQSEVDAWRNGSAQDRRRDRGAATARPTEPSIAVLPFLNLSSEKESEFFGDGLADEIISLLTRLPGLKVTARTSSFAFRGWNGDVREIGSKLGVRTLLEGSIRHAGGRMRISVQLVNAADGFHLWAEVYDRKSEDLFAVQDDVSRAVARALQIHSVPGAVPAGRRTSDMKAYREWLKGRYHLRNRRSAGEVIAGRDCFVHAIGIDPDFAAAYIGLAEYYREAAFLGLMPPVEAFREGKTQALRALELDGAGADAHATLAVFSGIFEFDWEAAERGFLRALELEPGSPGIHSQYAMHFLSPQGRLREAEARIGRVLELDPLSPEYHCQMGQIRLFQRRYAAAEAAVRTARTLGDYVFADWLLGVLCALQGRLEEAAGVCEDACKRYGNAPLAGAAMGALYAWMGRMREARKVLGRIETETNAGRGSPLGCAWIHMALGDKDRAFDWLHRAIDQHDPQVIHLPVKPIYDSLRGDPRFPALLRRIRLREYVGEPDPAVPNPA